ncbi:uncharacterized protein PV07_03018 [Cladophialophora immunda]|uniref:Transcription factor domain-containing protein n=1 Tax=Cladophialophora immunda TaxID=569365 RepID=A0A0D2B177_9EURO|nr:uncharacterized protein PV07_03018 [Cladophialophora immunda]KIW31362.1 hypothetical protein PV07_03018 [Cladophialophora immunda]
MVNFKPALEENCEMDFDSCRIWLGCLSVALCVVAWGLSKSRRRVLDKPRLDLAEKATTLKPTTGAALDYGKITPYSGIPIHDEPSWPRAWKPGPWQMTMGIRKLDVDDWIIYDSLFLDEHKQKLKRLQDPEVRPIIFQHQDGTYEASKEALGIIVQYITTRYPDMFKVDGDYLHILPLGESYRIQEPFDRHPLEIAGLIVYEDVYVLLKGPDDIYYLFFLKLKEGGGVQRNNQFIQTTPAIYHPEPLDDYPVCTSIDQVHIRIELQSLMRMPETQGLLFTIHPWVLPVKDLANEPRNLELLWSHARSFPESFSRYKLRHLWGGVLEEFAQKTLGKEAPDPELEADANAFTLRQPRNISVAEANEEESDGLDATWDSLPASTRIRSPLTGSPPSDQASQTSPFDPDDSVRSTAVSRSERRTLSLQIHGQSSRRETSTSKSTTSLHFSLQGKADGEVEPQSCHSKSPPSLLSPTVPYLIHGIETALEHELFHHYINFVPQAFSWATIRSAPFLSILIPLVLRDRGLLYTLLSIAATHLLNLGRSNMSEPRQRSIKSTRWQLRGKALKCHAEKMAAVSVPAFSDSSVQVKLDAALASTLLLLQLDCLDSGKDGHWRLHLFAASELARQRVKEGWSDKDPDGGAPANSRNETAVRFFLHLYRYYDVLACVTLDERPCPIDPVYSSEDIGSYSPLPQTYHSLLSILTQIVELRRRTLPELSLGQSTVDRNLADVNTEEFMKSLELCTLIQNWTIKSDSQEDLILGEVYRRACFIFLYLTTYPYGVADAKVQCALEEGLAHLELLASHEMALKCATFPLFIFGIAALQHDQQDMISKVLDLRFHQSGIGNVAEVLTFLKGWWIRECDENNRAFWLWEDEIRARQMYLFLV